MSWINRDTLFYLIMFLIVVAVVEVFATFAVHFRYKQHNPALKGIGFSSTIFIVDRALKKLSPKMQKSDHPPHELTNVPELTKSTPMPLFVPSNLHGYAHRSGEFKMQFYDRHDSSCLSGKPISCLHSESYSNLSHSTFSITQAGKAARKSLTS